MQPLTPDDVQQAIEQFDPTIRIQHFETSTATSELAAAAIGCELGQIAKSICFVVDGQAVLVVASGDQLVDDRKLAAYFNVGRKKVKLAKPDECLSIFGYLPGGVPPIGHRTAGITILLDTTMQRYAIMYAAAGTSQDNFGVPLPLLEKMTGGVFVDVVKENS
jgi:prolyl-tRNA editing enzyme YbaK/EbsC (Cys-tRNA(Pro) deacylase)